MTLSKVTELSDVVDAALLLPKASWTTLAAIEGTIVPAAVTDVAVRV
jgi:hypothetical protein